MENSENVENVKVPFFTFNLHNINETLTYPTGNVDLNRLSGNRKWVMYGDNNLLPQNFIDMFNTSPMHGSIVQKKAEYTAGKGASCTNPNAQRFSEDLDNGAGLHQLIQKIALDYYIHGGFSIQVLWNDILGKPADLVYQDWSTIRVGFSQDKNEDGEYEQGVWISADWSYSPSGFGTKFRPCYYPYFRPNEVESVPTFYLHKRYTPGYSWYPLPDWFAAVESIQTEVNLINFKKYTISNAFSPSGTLVIPGSMSAEETNQFKQMLETEYKGMKNAGKTLVLFSDGGINGDQKTDYIPFSANSPVKDVTDYLDQARQDIMIAHRLPSPTLIGLPGGASLGGDGGTIQSASKEFFDKVISVPQSVIKRELEKLFKYCGYETEIVIEQNIPFYE